MPINQNFSLFKQDYSRKSTIVGVEVYPLRSFTTEDGVFCEEIRMQENGTLTFQNIQGNEETIENFSLKQVNSSLLRPGSVKAWHLHKIQTDLWTVPPGGGHILTGLYDLREDSPSKGLSMRVYLGEYRNALLRIPPGVAHGYRNIGQTPAVLTYFVSEHFDPEGDEWRLAWDALEFNWDIENG